MFGKLGPSLAAARAGSDTILPVDSGIAVDDRCVGEGSAHDTNTYVYCGWVRFVGQDLECFLWSRK